MQHRRTKQRQAILEAMEQHGGHLTADQIYALVKPRFPHLSLGTVYRNLRILTAQGSVRELDFGSASKFFEMAKDAHYHLICRACGKVEDADLPVNHRLTAIMQSSAPAGGFQIEEHRLDFVGVCPACQRAQRRTRARAKACKRSEQ
jgi:Fur family peroxide stress response transcriptional regulator